jgi:hypothetical protein
VAAVGFGTQRCIEQFVDTWCDRPVRRGRRSCCCACWGASHTEVDRAVCRHLVWLIGSPCPFSECSRSSRYVAAVGCGTQRCIELFADTWCDQPAWCFSLQFQCLTASRGGAVACVPTHHSL